MKIAYSCHEIFLKLVPGDRALARAGTACHIGTRGHTVVAGGNRAGERNGLNFKLCFNRQFTVAFFISYGKISFSAEKKKQAFLHYFEVYFPDTGGVCAQFNFFNISYCWPLA